MVEVTLSKKEIEDIMVYLNELKLRDSTKVFLSSLEAQVKEGFRPTEGQLTVLYRIYNENKTWKKYGKVTFTEEVSQPKKKEVKE